MLIIYFLKENPIPQNNAKSCLKIFLKEVVCSLMITPGKAPDEHPAVQRAGYVRVESQEQRILILLEKKNHNGAYR